MIASLRRVHRAGVIPLGVALAVTIGLALSSRRSIPVQATSLAGEDAADPGDYRVSETTNVALGGPGEFTHRILVSDSSGPTLIELAGPDEPRWPDVLVYWSTPQVAVSASPTLPADARLLGTLSGSEPARFELPSEARTQDGNISFYSLAHGTVFFQSTLNAVGADGSGGPAWD